MAQKKNKNIFWKAFALLLCFLVVVVGILLHLGYKVMMDYDETQSYPMEKSSEIASQIAAGNFDLIFMDEKPNSYLFQKDEYYAYLQKLIDENGCTAVKGFSQDRYNHPIYDIKAGSETIAKVEFEINTEKSEYGFDSYYYVKTTPVDKGVYSIKVLVPDNCTLMLFGQEVSEKYKLQDETESIELSANTLFLGEDGAPMSALNCYYYYVEDLLTEPSPVIVYNDTGKEATIRYSNEYEAFTIDTFHLIVTCPSNYNVYINDMLISDDRFVKEAGVSVDGISEIAAKYVNSLVTMVTYEVTDLRYEDGNVVEVLDFEGNPQSKNEEYSTKQHYEYDVGITPQSLEYFGVSERYLIDRAEGYSEFINQDGDRYQLILPYVLKGTTVYEDFEEFWVVFSSHLEHWFENEQLEQVVFYQDDLFVADVSFDYWIKGFDHKTDNTKSYTTFVRFWYAKVNGEWKIVDYSLNR